MIPFILAAVGGYLIGDSFGKEIDSKVPKFEDGGGVSMSELDKRFQELGWRDTTEAYYGLDFTPFMDVIEEYVSMSELDKRFKELGWRDTTEAYYGLDFTPFMDVIENWSMKEKFAKGGQIQNLTKSGSEKIAELENILRDKINQNNGKQIKAKIITGDNDTVERFALSQGDRVMKMIKGKKRYGQLLVYAIPSIDRVIGVQFYDDTEKTYADELQTRQRYILKNLHPNLWSNLREQYSFSPERLDAFRRASQNMDSFESYQLASTYNLPNFDTSGGSYNRTNITMESAGMPKYAQEDLKRAIEEKRDYSYRWDCGYDCSVSTKMGDDGIYRGWFSQEYRGTGNGYYWLLISPTQAIFAERD